MSEIGALQHPPCPLFPVTRSLYTAVSAPSCFLHIRRIRIESWLWSTELFLAAAKVVFTFWVAYPASIALAKVLLQTAPDRGMPDGQMEGLLRVTPHIPMFDVLMLSKSNEIECRPNVHHLATYRLLVCSHSNRVRKRSMNTIRASTTPTRLLIRIKQTVTDQQVDQDRVLS